MLTVLISPVQSFMPTTIIYHSVGVTYNQWYNSVTATVSMTFTWQRLSVHARPFPCAVNIRNSIHICRYIDFFLWYIVHWGTVHWWLVGIRLVSYHLVYALLVYFCYTGGQFADNLLVEGLWVITQYVVYTKTCVFAYIHLLQESSSTF